MAGDMPGVVNMFSSELFQVPVNRALRNHKADEYQPCLTIRVE